MKQKPKMIPYPVTQEDKDFEEMAHMVDDLYKSARALLALRPAGLVNCHTQAEPDSRKRWQAQLWQDLADAVDRAEQG